MEWRKEFSFPFETLLYIISIVLLVLSFYLNAIFLFWFALFFFALNFVTRYYLKHLGDRLTLKNDHEVKRFFVNDEDFFEIVLLNGGKLPLFNGECEFVVDDCVEVLGVDRFLPGKTQNTYRFRIDVDQTSQLRIKVRGLARGAGKIRAVRLKTQDWFGMGTVYLSYDLLYRTELIVYPELRTVFGLERIETVWQGMRHTPHSLDEDTTAPTGTRAYLSSDPFNRIHWKASAKTGHLQTKVFEKTNGMTWVLLFNISREGMTRADLEREISCLAYICKFATEHGIPFQIYTNVKSPGRGQLLHIPSGEGRKQLVQTLELLARLQSNSVTLPAYWLLSYVDSRHYRNPVMILCNLFHRDDRNGTLQAWKKKGYGMYCVEHKEDGSYIVNMAKEKAVS